MPPCTITQNFRVKRWKQSWTLKSAGKSLCCLSLLALSNSVLSRLNVRYTVRQFMALFTQCGAGTCLSRIFSRHRHDDRWTSLRSRDESLSSLWAWSSSLLRPSMTCDCSCSRWRWASTTTFVGVLVTSSAECDRLTPSLLCLFSSRHSSRCVTKNVLNQKWNNFSCNRNTHMHTQSWLIDWVRLNVPPTHYRSYEDGFLRVKWPN